MAKAKKIVKIILWIVLLLGVAFGVYLSYIYYQSRYKFIPSQNVFTERVAYIDSEKALRSEGFETCNTYIYDYYNGGPDRTRYSKEKNGLRTFIMTNYKNRDYTDSGYLNIRFVVNCKGESGRYVIIENDLNLEPHKFSEDLKNQLFELTVQLKKWKPLVLNDENKDSYMYLSYRIVNGEITEILP